MLGTATQVVAEPLSKKVEIDFFRDSSSRNLKGLATRSDGRIVAGPVFTEMKGAPLADLLWTLTPASAGAWWVGTGPDGKILEVTLDGKAPLYAVKEIAKLDDSHVFAIEKLSDGSVLAGTSPNGGLHLLRGNKVVARLSLPADSVFDLKALDANTVLAATGNPGRIYRVDLKKMAEGGVSVEKVSDAKALAARGVTLFGEIRDRNVRRLALLANGTVLAGSAPKGNLYSFSRDGGSPVVLQENRDAEVTDLLVAPNGDVYAALVFSSSTAASSRINRSVVAAAATTEKDASTGGPATSVDATQERFSGRSTVVCFPAGNGFPETVVSRSGVAFYRLVRRGDQLLIASGEQGDFVGYDLKERRSLTFPGSVSSQLNGLVSIDGQRFLALRNNAPGLALIDFAAKGARELETRRLDLGIPGQLGSLRFNRLRDVADGSVGVALRTNFGSDELEGWTAWTPLPTSDGGWRAVEAQRGRYLMLRLSLPENTPTTVELDKAQFHYLPQNRRPTLTEFRLFAANYALLPAPEPIQAATTTLGQILSPAKDNSDEKRRNALLASAVIPSPGMQIAYWNLNDPDGDELAATFSLRRDGDTQWTDLAFESTVPFAQFDTSHLPDGVYFTRLAAMERAPRAVSDRLGTIFETDDLIIDRTPPEWISAKAERQGDLLAITVKGRDKLSLLEGLEVRFNNGLVETVEQTADGIRDSREETFVIEVPFSRVAPATNVEVVLYDAVGNGTARRLTW